jgi:hypothetical protein
MTFVLAYITTSRLGRTLKVEDLTGLEGSKVVYFGKPNPSQEQCSSFDLDICPDLLLALIAAASAAGFILLYIAITVNPMGKRRRKRSAEENYLSVDTTDFARDFLYNGMLYFTQSLCSYCGLRWLEVLKAAWKRIDRQLLSLVTNILRATPRQLGKFGEDVPQLQWIMVVASARFH